MEDRAAPQSEVLCVTARPFRVVHDHRGGACQCVRATSRKLPKLEYVACLPAQVSDTSAYHHLPTAWPPCVPSRTSGKPLLARSSCCVLNLPLGTTGNLHVRHSMPLIITTRRVGKYVSEATSRQLVASHEWMGLWSRPPTLYSPWGEPGVRAGPWCAPSALRSSPR